MKIVQVIPKASSGSNLKTLLNRKERSLRGKATTFYMESQGKWKHERYSGWINLEGTKGGFLIAEIQTRKQTGEWQLLQAFVGYLDRHLGQHIESISIYYK